MDHIWLAGTSHVSNAADEARSVEFGEHGITIKISTGVGGELSRGPGVKPRVPGHVGVLVGDGKLERHPNPVTRPDRRIARTAPV